MTHRTDEQGKCEAWEHETGYGKICTHLPNDTSVVSPTIPERVEEICGFDFEGKLWSDSGFEEFKQLLRTTLTETDQQARETERLRIKIMLEELPAFTSCSDKTMGQVSDEAKKPAYGTNYLQREAVLTALSNPPSQV